MIRIETWARNPEGIYDVTVIRAGRRYTYPLLSSHQFNQFLINIKNKKYHDAFQFVAPEKSDDAATAACATPPAANDDPAARLSDGRKRPDPAEAMRERAEGGDLSQETGWLWPEASRSIASADNRSVMLYPF